MNSLTAVSYVITGFGIIVLLSGFVVGFVPESNYMFLPIVKDLLSNSLQTLRNHAIEVFGVYPLLLFLIGGIGRYIGRRLENAEIDSLNYPETFRFPETSLMHKRARPKNTIEKLKKLQAKKKILLLEIDQLEKLADEKMRAVERS